MTEIFCFTQISQLPNSNLESEIKERAREGIERLQNLNLSWSVPFGAQNEAMTAMDVLDTQYTIILNDALHYCYAEYLGAY
jgi:hypothetical protein